MKKKAAKIILLAALLVLASLTLYGCGEDAGSSADDRLSEIYLETGEYLSEQAEQTPPGVNSIGGEWLVIGLTRSGVGLPGDCREAYMNTAKEYIEANIDENGRLHKAKSTDNSRVILALTALGEDASDIDSYDLIAGLSDMDYVKMQGTNGPIWALIALDSNGYEIPANTAGGEQVTREKLVECILSLQLEDGGWNLTGESADTDMTAMAIQSLAPYYETDNQVKASVDEAVECLSQMQSSDGGYSSWGSLSSESCAQVIVALTSLGIDPHADERFIKDGGSVIDALLTFHDEDGGFRHTADDEVNGMSTEQAYYAMVSYYRMKEGKTPLYDMSDAA